MQKRAKTKEYCPGYLDLIIGGMVSKEDSDNLKQVNFIINLIKLQSAIREIKEEIGLDVSSLSTEGKMISLLNNFII